MKRALEFILLLLVGALMESHANWEMRSASYIARDLAPGPSTNRFYVLRPESVQEFDFESGKALTTTNRLPTSVALRLRATADTNWLMVSAGTVVFGAQFTSQSNTFKYVPGGASGVTALGAHPLYSNVVVACTATAGSVVVSNAVVLGTAPCQYMQFSSGGDSLLGLQSIDGGVRITRHSIGQAGVELAVTRDLAGAALVRFEILGNDLILSDGTILDTATLDQSGKLPDVSTNSLFTVIPSMGEVIFVDPTGTLRRYDAASRAQVEKSTFTPILGTFIDLIPVGANLAFHSDSTVFMLRRTVPTDLVVSVAPSTANAIVGQPQDWTVTVTNRGPAPARSVTLTITNWSITTQARTLRNVATNLSTSQWTKPLLNPGEDFAVTLRGFPAAAGFVGLLATVSAPNEELIPGDNHAEATQWARWPTAPPARMPTSIPAGRILWDEATQRLFLVTSVGPV
jgi:hypothetical protein